ncbi:MAG: hydroxyisourate hydrolase [Rhodobacteraceae bacterium]|nr:hydroxyisourate hydrolase [Paracoccaceae bacterium]
MATVTSHALNGVDGTHAVGVSVRLVNLTTGREMFAAATDEGGRLSKIVDLSDCNSDDRYELTFATDSYWLDQGFTERPFLRELVLRFLMPVPDARYHMPVILSPNSYSCWVSAPETSMG